MVSLAESEFVKVYGAQESTSKESIPPGEIGWRNRLVLLLKRLQIRALGDPKRIQVQISILSVRRNFR
jgi:hypothetical protein